MLRDRPTLGDMLCDRPTHGDITTYERFAIASPTFCVCFFTTVVQMRLDGLQAQRTALDTCDVCSDNQQK